MDRRRTMLCAAAMVLSATGAGAAAWWLHRRRREAQIFKRAAAPEFQPPFTDAHIAALRRLRFCWDRLTEDGGPIVDPFRPYGGDSLADDLAGMIGTRDALAVLSFHTEVAALLAWALKNAPMAEGSYDIERRVRDGMAASLHRIVSHLPSDHAARVLAGFPFLREDAPFALKREHIQLLRHLRFAWPSAAMIAVMQSRGWLPVATVNFKRPFGDMSAYELDMEQILALSPSTDTSGRHRWLATLYRELWRRFRSLSRMPTLA